MDINMTIVENEQDYSIYSIFKLIEQSSAIIWLRQNFPYLLPLLCLVFNNQIAAENAFEKFIGSRTPDFYNELLAAPINIERIFVHFIDFKLCFFIYCELSNSWIAYSIRKWICTKKFARNWMICTIVTSVLFYSWVFMFAGLEEYRDGLFCGLSSKAHVFGPQMKKQLKPTAIRLLECYCFKTVPEFGHRSTSMQSYNERKFYRNTFYVLCQLFACILIFLESLWYMAKTMTSSDIYSECVLYNEILRRNPKSIKDMFSETKINEIKRFISLNEDIPRIKACAQVFLESRKRPASCAVGSSPTVKKPARSIDSSSDSSDNNTKLLLTNLMFYYIINKHGKGSNGITTKHTEFKSSQYSIKVSEFYMKKKGLFDS
uniref:G_PROTEIN_RECEP_F1_2 domain-containing protein n=1 Tax=Heterorhabditis bacteriophora TaxID=37862 RepID=A0A1I7XCA5_HETBA